MSLVFRLLICTFRSGARAVLAVLAAWCCASSLVAQSAATTRTTTPATLPVNPEAVPRPVAHAAPASGPIVIDGLLDEGAWQHAEPLTGFVQSQPHTGYPATEETIVRILFDADRLYIGAECHDSEPHRIVVPSLEQDFQSGDSDIFGVTLDTFHDRRNAFMFLFNPRGAVKDAQDFDDSRLENAAWEGIITVRTRTHERGWTVELAIPFTTLRFDPLVRQQIWGVNFLRRVRRKNEEAYWAPLERADRIHRMSRAGTLEGLQNLRPGRNLTLKPYGLMTTSSAVGRPLQGDLDGGADMKLGVTPQLTLDLTWRTNFSQVEVDQEQVNLTRFSLFYPEKRDFFIENSGTFSFGDIAERNLRLGASLADFSLFDSRRIGLTSSGEPIPIVGGARLTGKTAGFELGLLDMQTEATANTPPENFLVTRLRRNIGDRADLGAMFLNRQATGDRAGRGYNRSYGFDANFRPVGHLVVNSYFAGSQSPGSLGSTTAARLTVGWRDRLWDTSAFVKQIGEGFKPGIGFVSRRAMRHTYATVGAHPRPRIRFVQEVNPYAELNYITNLESVLETRNTTLGFAAQFFDGGRLGLSYKNGFERLFEPFLLLPHTLVPAGDYLFDEVTASYQSSAGRAISGQVSLTTGGFYDGTKTSTGVSALLRAGYRLAVQVSLNRNDIDLPNDSLSANVFSLKAKYGFSTTLFASGLVQYNAAADQVVTNLRLNYIHSPLSHLFIVYSDRRGMLASGVSERAVTVKITKLLAF